ncbi:MAG: hypothetical protein AB3N15_14290 [Paracoccaceae bacterium]
MAQSTLQERPGFSVSELLGRIGSSIYAVLVNLAEARSHAKEIQFLQSLSDNELKRRGLSRDRIVHHIFAGSVWRI